MRRSSTGGAWAAQIIRSAAERTLATGTARVDAFASHDGPSPRDGAFMGEGVADFSLRRVQFIARFVTENVLAEKRQQYPGKRRGLALLAGLSEPFDVFYDGADRYVRMPAHDPGWRGPFDGPRSGPRSTSDPTWKLCALLGANDDVGPAEDRTIRGIHTKGFALTLNLETANTRVPGGITIDRARSWIGRRREGTTWFRRVPALAWIDGEGHVRRVSVAHLARPAEPRAPASWFGTEFWDLGGPPPLEIPALGSTEDGPRTDDA